MRKVTRWAAGLVIVAGVGSARGDDANFRAYLIGARASGMGGAFTALADDGSGGYYNPGGLAFIERSSVSLSGSFYGIVRGTFADLLQQGQDFTFSRVNLVPSVTAAVKKLSRDDTLHFDVFVPDSVRIDERQGIFTSTNAFGYSVEAQTLWIGGGYSRRLGRVGLGAVVYGLIGSETDQLDLNVINAQDPGRFIAITERLDQSTVGFVGGLGVRVDATDELRLGASIYSPAVGFGSRRAFIRVLAGRDVGQPGTPPTSVVKSADGLFATPANPLRVQLGAAWQHERLTVAADLVYLGGRELTDDPGRAADGLDRHIVRKPVIDASVGLEYLAHQKVPLRAGLFTDFAATQSPDEIGAGARPYNTLHVNRFGVTGSAGYRTDNVTTDVGFNLAYGSGTEYLPVQLDFSNVKATTATQLFVYLFLATSYEF